MQDDGRMFCFACGAAIRADSAFCSSCGAGQREAAPEWEPAPLASKRASPSGRSKLVAALFALFLGSIGLHRFYLGRPISGFLYLAFCWTFIPAIVSFFEAIGLLLMSDGDFAANYP